MFFVLSLIPAEMVPALIHMRKEVADPQPKRLEACQQMVELVQSRIIEALEFPSATDNLSLIEEVGRELG